MASPMPSSTKMGMASETSWQVYVDDIDASPVQTEYDEKDLENSQYNENPFQTGAAAKRKEEAQ